MLRVLARLRRGAAPGLVRMSIARGAHRCPLESGAPRARTGLRYSKKNRTNCNLRALVRAERRASSGSRCARDPVVSLILLILVSAFAVVTLVLDAALLVLAVRHRID